MTVLVHTAMSLDGFIAGVDDAMDWVFEFPSGPDEATEKVIRTAGAILAGRRSYEVGRKAQRPETSEPFGGHWTGPQFVLTHDPPEDEEDPTITFLSGDIRDAVATALEAAEGKNVLIFGANVARQCLDEGLVDEILIQLAPVLLGDGVRLFGDPGRQRTDLETVSVERVGQMTNLWFRVLK